MSSQGEHFEVESPILNSPFLEPNLYWFLKPNESPKLKDGRRPAIVYSPRDQKKSWDISDGTLIESTDFKGGFELILVNEIRKRVNEWRKQDYPGVTRTTLELLHYWRRDGREKRLFFAQLEAVETIIFLKEARADLLQGINIPWEKIPDGSDAKGFQRYANKMATGSGKSTVMAMLAAWSILNKSNSRQDTRFSDVVLVVCPNVTIRDRLRELQPAGGEASIYRTRDLVPSHLMAQMLQGRVIITNWHAFQPQSVQSGGVSSRVLKSGVAVKTTEWVNISHKNDKARGQKYMTITTYNALASTGEIRVLEEDKDKEGNLKRAKIESTNYVESDSSLINRLIGREAGNKKNILVLNDEAHHAYRIHREEDEDEGYEEEDADEFYQEAAVWVDGLDKINKLRGINFAVDLSATPYFLGRAGQDTNRPFPWVVSDFGLIEAIESGLVKIPQMPSRDPTGLERAAYFNVWEWVTGKLTPAERGPKRGSPKPEAILKWAQTPINILGAEYQTVFKQWSKDPEKNGRPPVFIVVCKNTAIAKIVHDWLSTGESPSTTISPSTLELFKNRNGELNTIRVDTKIVQEVDTGNSKEDEKRWMRFTLDTIGRINWPKDLQGKILYPEGFLDLAQKLGRPLDPPGAKVRCIVSVGMLTEGWDCNTVTHIIGLRPFMSQLLCEQVVGRGLRRASYEAVEKQLPNGKTIDAFSEEVAQVFGVPFEVIPFKASTGVSSPKEPRNRVFPIPERAEFAITYPRVERYSQAIRNKIAVDWSSIPRLKIQPGKIPPEVLMKGVAYNSEGRMSLHGPGTEHEASLKEWREHTRIQQIEFKISEILTKEFMRTGKGEVPQHILFPQILAIIKRYISEHVVAEAPADKKDIFISPYYGWVIETLLENLRPDTIQGESPEIPIYEKSRKDGSTFDVDFWTSKPIQEVKKSHLNAIVADTKKWEQQAAYFIDRHSAVDCFVKNAGLGFAIPYIYNGQSHDYEPDFIIRLKTPSGKVHLILETKGFDEKKEYKINAAQRWVQAVNADGTYGNWAYECTDKMTDVPKIIDEVLVKFK